MSIAHILANLEREGLIVRGYAEIEVPRIESLRAWVNAASRLSPVQ